MTAWLLSLALAGDPCRGVPVEVDEGAALGSPSWSVTRPGFRLAVHDDHPFLTLYVAEPGVGLEVERFEEPMVLAFEDDTRMKLFPGEGSGPSRQLGYVSGDTYVPSATQFALRAPLSAEAVHLLAGSRAEVVRFRVLTEGRKVEVSSLFAASLQRAAACLANTGWP